MRKTPAATSFSILARISGLLMTLRASPGRDCMSSSACETTGSRRMAWISGSAMARCARCARSASSPPSAVDDDSLILTIVREMPSFESVLPGSSASAARNVSIALW
jgi:hypothetical protein